VRLGPSTGSHRRRRRWRAAFRTVASRAAAWCSLAGAASSAASRPPKSTPPAPSAESIAQDKDLTKRLLHAPACPCRTAARWTMWRTPGLRPREIGLPVVVKPQDGNQGKGVTVNITTAHTSKIAYKPPPISAP
jgi:cyanophycin synthetase